MDFINICIFLLLLNCTISRTNDVNKEYEKSTENECCNNLTTHRVVVDFSTKIIENEFIITFDGYYKTAARENYIKSAINNTKVCYSFKSFTLY